MAVFVENTEVTQRKAWLTKDILHDVLVNSLADMVGCTIEYRQA